VSLLGGGKDEEKKGKRGRKVTRKGNTKKSQGVCKKGENCTMQKYWIVLG